MSSSIMLDLVKWGDQTRKAELRVLRHQVTNSMKDKKMGLPKLINMSYYGNTTYYP